MVNSNRGTVWSAEEIDLIVADYFEMYQLELAGISFNKTARIRALQQVIGRSDKSIEYKWRNISAVVHELGNPFVRGLAPAVNYQAALVEAVAARVETVKLEAPVPVLRRTLEVTTMPTGKSAPVAGEAAMNRLIGKFDPAVRDARNRELGLAGEQLVFDHECQRLVRAQRSDLANQVQWVSRDCGDGAGFDILSFDSDGNERLLEVKATNGSGTTPFYISENERVFSEKRSDAFHLIRVYDLARAPKAYELRPPLDTWLRLDPTNYRASIRP